MLVFKFGGASVKDAAAVKNVAGIITTFPDEKLIVVVSAMGKTTNALEQVVHAKWAKDPTDALLAELKKQHLTIADAFFSDKSNPVYNRIHNIFVELEWCLEEEPSKGYDFLYDQVVSSGELLSTAIVFEYLLSAGLKVAYADARDLIKTDENFREGNVDWSKSQVAALKFCNNSWTEGKEIILTQGFIGGTSDNYTTTLGREGSDYSAAVLAYCLDASAVYIWKDVPGVLNADPKFFTDAQKLERMSYHDAIELAYFGASVIHPKTIKPLENKDIPLHVKSFINPAMSGTVIGKGFETKPLIPSFIFKADQILISIAAKDFSFIAEDSLSNIFGLFANAGVKINLMQNSAISFSVCMDNDSRKIPQLLTELMKDYKVRYNENLQLYTVRHYYPSTIEMLTRDKEVLLEQRSRQTAQLVTREIEK